MVVEVPETPVFVPNTDAIGLGLVGLIGAGKVPFDDRAVVREILRTR